MTDEGRRRKMRMRMRRRTWGGIIDGLGKLKKKEE